MVEINLIKLTQLKVDKMPALFRTVFNNSQILRGKENNIYNTK